MVKPIAGEHGPHVIKYRPDVDGLRAVAVISVVIFHAFPTLLSGGFVGVDVFFVISGYLITSIIVSDLDDGRFSFATFYTRRIRRLFPALLVVLAACLVAGWFLLLPDEYQQLGKHVAGGAAFIANFIFWKEANYFDTSANTKILLHLWSLGVEEQYYLIWPALVLAVRKTRFNLALISIVLLVGSFAISVHSAATNPPAAFYSPLSRFWELLAGGLLAYFTQLRPVLRKPLPLVLCEAMALLGALLLAVAIVKITPKTTFPGWWALLPVLGTCLLVLAGPLAWLNSRVLSNRAVVWIGLISYPLYLWHWPLLAFAHNAYAEPSWMLRLELVVASVVLAWLTYRFIETPLRFGTLPVRVRILGLIGAMVCVAVFGIYDLAKSGIPGRLKDRAEYAAYFEGYLYDASKHTVERAQIAQNQCNFYRWNSPFPSNAPRDAIDPECYTRHTSKAVLILGDSNAADLYYGLKEVLPKEISTLLIFSSGCPVRALNDAQIQADHCNMTNHFALERIKLDPPDVVLMSSNSSFDINYIRTYSVMIRKLGVKHIFVLGQRPHWKPYLYKIIMKSYWYSTPHYIPGHQDDELLALGNAFESKLKSNEPFDYVEERSPFCNSDGCLTYLGDDRKTGLITFDDAHLRPFASVYLAKKQLGPMIVNALRTDEANAATR
ncbi:MAG TPA: acyltransferase family protein [Bradyrhizobium sp.]|uniref:acyltransferase family protein n=1 Tax=Bradyrhizobium sp. TaxID=376 RepID=UPI002B544099|nr:acyltransferase family protein [Bradyrhizobium sp.]HLZ03205.1 acyltransferase family protein [Bradyrhizobium sp.]